jgi:hypothetical protein
MVADALEEITMPCTCSRSPVVTYLFEFVCGERLADCWGNLSFLQSTLSTQPAKQPLPDSERSV